ncbi:MAG: hypothetical protein M3R27_05680 [Bacteroidota bacterium]|nr:hypothetical protein [Bacteroidota bacterium]
MKNISPRFLFISTAILVAAISRIFPHVPNFTPIAAMALFGGVYLQDKRAAFIIPLAAMLISDIILEITTGWGFHNTLIYVYAAFILTTVIGLYIRKNPSVQGILAGSVLSSALFFMITNFGVWAASGFPMGVAGLGATYALGVPFFAPTLLGDLFFNALLFGSFYLAQRRYPVLIKA